SNSYVRICYDPRDHVILRLEIRDFKGELKDYSKSEGMFPSVGDVKTAGGIAGDIPIPWSSAFVLLFFLDLAGIQMVIPRYYRSFFPIKTNSVGACAVPLSLMPDRKIELRNSMMLWDREDHAIWLRPRGLNLFQVPWTIARFKVDQSNR